MPIENLAGLATNRDVRYIRQGPACGWLQAVLSCREERKHVKARTERASAALFVEVV